MPVDLLVSLMRYSNWARWLESVRSGSRSPDALAGRLDVDDLVLRRAAGSGDHDLLPHLPLEYGPAHRGGVAELPARRVRLVGADYLERPFLSLPADDPEGYPSTEVDRVFLDFRRVDNLRVAYPALELTDPALQQALFVLRLVVLGVLRDVTELTSLADAVGNLLATRLGQVCEFLLELLETFRGNELLVLIGHKPRDYKGGCKGCQRGNAACGSVSARYALRASLVSISARRLRRLVSQSAFACWLTC